jgi:hypothetical protein
METRSGNPERTRGLRRKLSAYLLSYEGQFFGVGFECDGLPQSLLCQCSAYCSAFVMAI